MTVYNPSIRAMRLKQGGPLRKNRQIKAELEQTRDTLDGLVSFVTSQHLSVTTFRACARQEPRATSTLDALGRILDLDLVGTAQKLFELLDETATQPLVEFQAGDAAHLFATIDSIAPDGATVGDGRTAAEKFHYAAEARTALLRHALAAINQRYPPASFSNLGEASAWTNAFAALIQEASEVIAGTQALLYDEATAVQSYLDTLRNRFLFIEEQARAAAVLVRYDWRSLLETAESQVLDHLARQHEQLEELAFAELKEAQASGWLQAVAWQTARNAPLLGSLLLTIAGGAAILSDARPSIPEVNLTLPGRGTLDDFANKVRTFPVLKRHSEALRPAPEPRVQDEIAQFFSVQPRPRGRHTLAIPDSATLSRVLDELAEFGYARRDVLRLLNLNSVNEVAVPIRLDIRWSQGGRPLLLPLYGEASAPVEASRAAVPTQGAASLKLVAERFGVPEETIRAQNPSLQDRSGVTGPIVVELPPQSWMAQRDEAVLSWGASLDKIARELDLSVDQLADLNDIADPESWLYEGHALRLPVVPGGTEAPVQAAAIPIDGTGIRFAGGAKPVNSLIVHRVQPGDTLAALSRKYDTTIAELMESNRLEGDRIESGQMLLVPVTGRVTTSSMEAKVLPETQVRSGGSLPASRVPTAVTAPHPPDAVQQLVSRYGARVFPTTDEMPPELRAYFTSTVQEVADFFNVRPGDLLGILKAENNNAGYRIYQPAASPVGAVGVAQVVPRTWNGWSNPATEAHITDLRSIERYGGIGFDWSLRDEWLRWKQGESDGEALATAQADPNKFEDAVAAVARHLVQYGLTRDRAASNPDWFQQRLADAIAVYNSGKPLSESADFRQSAQNPKTTAEYVQEAITTSEATPESLERSEPAEQLRQAYLGLMDRTFGVRITDEEFQSAVDGAAILGELSAGTLSVDDAARRLLRETEQHYLAEGRAARANGEPLPWPYVHDEPTLFAQKEAVRFLGRTLTAAELAQLVEETDGEPDAITRALGSRGDARLFAGAQQLFDELLQRTTRGQPVANHEVAGYVQTAMAGFDPTAMGQRAVQETLARIERAIKRLPEYRELHGVTRFSATPLSPMPTIMRSFGVPVHYQVGGKHTGIDVANPRVDGKEPPIYAVDDGEVVHVGPLYCHQADACRGGDAIVVHHGDHLYSIYSHNSVATVSVGQRVSAGQVIGRQGDEGYSFGSHLHFEIHSGAPFTGDWRQPFQGGEFADPLDYLPETK